MQINFSWLVMATSWVLSFEQHCKQDGGREQYHRGIEHMHDFIEAQSRPGVGTRQFMHPAGVPVEEAHTCRPVPFCFWVAKILTGSSNQGTPTALASAFCKG